MNDCEEDGESVEGLTIGMPGGSPALWRTEAPKLYLFFRKSGVSPEQAQTEVGRLYPGVRILESKDNSTDTNGGTRSEEKQSVVGDKENRKANMGNPASQHRFIVSLSFPGSNGIS